MVAGHLDEIGFMITQIDDKGFLKFPNSWRLVGTSNACPTCNGNDA